MPYDPARHEQLDADGRPDIDAASYLLGETSILLLSDWVQPDEKKAARF